MLQPAERETGGNPGNARGRTGDRASRSRGLLRCLFIGALLAIPAHARGQPPATPSVERLTLEQALSLALKNNRTVQNSRLEAEKTEQLTAAARTQRLPVFDLKVLESQNLTTMDFEFKKGAFGRFEATGPIPSKDTTISMPRGEPSALVFASVAQPISQLYRIGLGIQLQEMGHAVAREKLRSARHTVGYEVKRAYYLVAQMQSALEVAEETLKFLRELDRVVEEQVTHQTALKSDSLDVKARLAKAEHEALTLRNSLATQKEQLNDLLGRDIRTEFTVSPAPEPAALGLDLDVVRRRAVERRPEVREGRLKAEQAEYDLRMKRAEYIPDVSLVLNYFSAFNYELLPKNVASVGLQLSWDVFDWGRKKRELAEKSKALEQARNGIDEARTQVAIDVNHRLNKLREAQSLLRVVQVGQEAAREKLRIITDKFAQQTALLKDVLEAQAALAEANHQHQHALLSFWTARADFERAIGED